MASLFFNIDYVHFVYAFEIYYPDKEGALTAQTE
jgi:hypothetical protein